MVEGAGRQLLVQFDTTGSMYPVFHEVKRRLSGLVSSMMNREPNLQIALLAHGDYCDRGQAIRCLDFTSDLSRMLAWVDSVKRTNGGDYAEFYDYMFRWSMANLSWDSRKDRSYVVIGDAYPHGNPVEEYRRYSFWDYSGVPSSRGLEVELGHVVDAGITTYAVWCQPDRSSERERQFFSAVGNANNGAMIELEQFDLMPDLLEAIDAKNADRMDQFVEQQPDRLRLNVGFQKIVEKLTGDGSGVTKAREESRSRATGFGRRYSVGIESELIPVPSGRFQVAHVTEKVKIKAFVDELVGESYRAGRGFYQLTKTELVQDSKEVILRDRETGQYFGGAVGRQMLGLPSSGSARVNPKKHPVRDILERYDIYIQSRSYTRHLIGGQKFLYEADK